MAQSQGSGSQDITWVPTTHGNIPVGAVRAGKDVDGGRIYVIRASHEGDLIPGKLSHTKTEAFISWAGQEIAKVECEILVAISRRVAWKLTAYNYDIPTEAVEGGHTAEGETLYIGRALQEGVLVPGKIHPSHQSLYIPWGGREIIFEEFEILIAY